jgi:hypothetical protein
LYIASDYPENLLYYQQQTIHEKHESHEKSPCIGPTPERWNYKMTVTRRGKN